MLLHSDVCPCALLLSPHVDSLVARVVFVKRCSASLRLLSMHRTNHGRLGSKGIMSMILFPELCLLYACVSLDTWPAA